MHEKWKQNWWLRLIALAMAALVWFYVKWRTS